MQAARYPRWFRKIPTNYWPSYPSKSGSQLYASIVLGYILLLLAFLLWEWLAIGILAIPSVIEDYHFGSAAMLGEGGPHYASAELYAHTALKNVLFPVLPLVVLFVLAVVKNNIFYRTLAWISLLTALIINIF